jgi:peroxin-1
MQSKRKLAPIVNRDGIAGTRGNSGREQDVSVVEIDATFARTLGLADGQKITASLHLDPPIAHTVNIEPLTADDWEIIELHANFLEINLIHQVRALPNPSYTSSTGSTSAPHPLTLHLSPTSTANIVITSLVPAPPSTLQFAKLAPDAEVIVAPKTRSKPSRSSGESRSVTSRKSAGGRSGASTVRRRSGHDEVRPAMFFRGLDRHICDDYFDASKDTENCGMKVWVDREVLLSRALKGVKWACVTVVRPPSLQTPIDPQKLQQELETMRDVGKVASKVVARIMPWDDAPDSQHVALSTSLCSSMACEGLVGGVVKVEPAPAQLDRASSKRPDDTAPKFVSQVVKVYPFASGSSKTSDGLKFGGESNAQREDASRLIQKMYGSDNQSESILDGPLTDGSILGTVSAGSSGWAGGILRFDQRSTENSKKSCHWFLGSERKFNIDVQAPIPKPLSITDNVVGDSLPSIAPTLVGIDSLIEQFQSHLSHMSSVLLTGALGSGKSSVAHLLAHRLRSNMFFHTTYISCRKLVSHETQASNIKETFNRLFMDASWGARLGGKSLVILDDLDKICPAETELEVGNDNGRSRQISEGICSVVRQYSARESGIVLLATAQAKESLHNVIVGGHVVREIVALKAPNKEGRRRVVEMVVRQNASDQNQKHHKRETSLSSRPTTDNGSVDDEDGGGWMDNSSPVKRDAANGKPDGFVISPDLDFLDLSGETDGYMPGDLVLLVGRARSEALIRSVSESPNNTDSAAVDLNRADFDKALKGFTPASLRNVTLQTSTTTFASIGGLHATRKILLETLQYPTTYAPIFAQCPLRLRSGLLLYGYPGCGKTMLASAVAGECGLNFISVKGPEILNKYIGASEKSVRDLFERAEAARPCVLFFDEFDSIAPKRGHDSTGVTDRVVNQLLTQMDGAEGLSGVYVLAATSRPDLIDPALLRPGRLDKSLICDLPNLEDRIDILLALGKKLKLSPEVIDSLSDIASQTDGHSGADLQALIYNAHLEAIHDVLGDQDHGEVGTKKTNGVTSKNQDFVQFRYGIEEDAAEQEARSLSGTNKSKVLAERLAISTKLSEIKAAKKRAKLAQRNQSQEANTKGKEEKEQQEVVIEWKHVEKSLASTRASISAQERGRLGKVYREFVEGRDGNMRNGEGNREVGGRTSLM